MPTQSSAPAGSVTLAPAFAAARPEDARILLVDDHDLTVRTVKTILAKDSYAVVQGTTDPFEASRLFAELRPDIVLLDVAMPGLDGFRLLDRLQADADQRFAAVFISGNEEREIRTEAFRRGAADFVAKPVDETELRLRVRNQARIIAFERTLEAQNEHLAQAVAERTTKLEDAIRVMRQAENRLVENLRHAEDKNRDKMSFFASINHELRTPLNAISGFAEILKDQVFGSLGDPKYVEYAHDIHDAATYLQRLINDVLDLSRTESTEFQLDIRPIHPETAVRAGLVLVEDQARRGNVKLVVDIEPGLPVIRTDEERLKQIVINLASNAIKFTPAGGSVTVKVKKDSDKGILILAISDTGIGIATEDLLTVLKPFGQVRRVKTAAGASNATAGTGLGLPISKRLAELMGGSLEIESRPGVGTVVTVRLPLEPA